MRKNTKPTSKENAKKSKDKSNMVLDVLRGRIPPYEDNIRFYISLVVIAGLWIYIISQAGGWTLSIPGVSALIDYFKNGRSP